MKIMEKKLRLCHLEFLLDSWKLHVTSKVTIGTIYHILYSKQNVNVFLNYKLTFTSNESDKNLRSPISSFYARLKYFPIAMYRVPYSQLISKHCQSKNLTWKYAGDSCSIQQYVTYFVIEILFCVWSNNKLCRQCFVYSILPLF